ncbi:MAG TPA: 50S ribosomal protein L22 [Candidatus Nanoarchaeia archaeon]|nr:50S ribosomal protein L22 [Candidatus Nanoarchaeia archaeon]
MNPTSKFGPEQLASAKALNLSIATKTSIEICNHIRYKNTAFAKKFLEEVLSFKKAVPFKRFVRDLGHKKGISSGRYPVKAAAEFLRLIKSAESNAQAKGLETVNLKIVQLLANRASIPITGGRHRYGTKRTHLEITVRGNKGAKKVSGVKTESRAEPKPELKNAKTEPKLEPKTMGHPTVHKDGTNVAGAKPVKETVLDVKTEAIKANPKTVVEPPKELSSAELLKKVQLKAEEHDRNQKEKHKREKDVNEVSNLYEELKKKGTLRK